MTSEIIGAGPRSFHIGEARKKDKSRSRGNGREAPIKPSFRDVALVTEEEVMVGTVEHGQQIGTHSSVLLTISAASKFQTSLHHSIARARLNVLLALSPEAVHNSGVPKVP